MPTSTFDDLLIEADATARSAEWQQTFDTLSRASRLQPRHAGVITGQGTCLLQLGQPQQALPYFQHAAELEPASPEAHNNLGVAYLLTGALDQAEAACRRALEHDANNLSAWRNLALACLRQGRAQEGVSILAAVVRAHPDDNESMLLLARCYLDGGQPQSARYLYQRVLDAQPDHPEARAALAALAPPPAAPSTAALSRLARPEHANKLAQLRKKPAGSAPMAALPVVTTPALPAAPPRTPAGAGRCPVVGRAGLGATARFAIAGASVRPAAPAPHSLAVAFYGPAEVLLGGRVEVPAGALHRRGHRVSAGLSSAAVDSRDVCVFSRPQLSPDIIGLMEQRRRAGARLVVDLDQDFHQIPPDHPGYTTIGPGNAANFSLLDRAIAEADLLVVATPVLAERYGSKARQVVVLPSGWNDANPLWNKPSPRRRTLNIGWAGSLTHRSDFALILPALVRLVREMPQVQLVIGGDPAIYESLAAVPENRRLFLPMASYEDYPYLLSHFDLLLAPLRDTPFNRAKSDIALLEAGVRRIPWVASPRPACQAWGVGGLLAEEPDEWFAALSRLAGDPALRRSLGEAGRAQADTRESRLMAPAWEAALAALDAAPQP